MLSEGRLVDLLDHLSIATLLVDASQTVRYMNPAGEHMLHTSLRQVEGTPLVELLGDDALPALVERVLESGRTVAKREVSLGRIPGNGGLVVDCMLTPIDGREPVLIELRDAASRMRLDRDAAQTLQQGVSRSMVRQLAHEIKNPLGGLRGAAQLLERRLPPGDDLRDYTGVILREADRLTALVDKLLGPARHPMTDSVNIHELLHDVQRLIEAEAPDSVEVRVDFDPSLPAVMVDRDEMVQACLNIARNALQALPERGWIMFRTRALTQTTIQDTRYPLGMQVDIEDNGPGAPEALRETMFYPLVSGRPDGTGIGLPVAQELIRRQGGSLTYIRTPPDHLRPETTVFSIRLPLERSE